MSYAKRVNGRSCQVLPTSSRMSGTSSIPFPPSRCRHLLPQSQDYAVFALLDFDPNDYANAVLAGEPYPQSGGGSVPASAAGRTTGTGNARSTSASRGIGSGDAEDISVLISKLTYNIEDVEKQVKNVVRAARVLHLLL